MRIALIASPFISVPPKKYGGTELFIAQLAEGLTRLGIDVVVYANGESTVQAELRWLYAKDEWPIDGELYSNLKDSNHTSWAVSDCWREADIIHLNNAPGLVFSRLSGPRWVYTMHHPHAPALSAFYAGFPNVEFVSISNFQKEKEALKRIRTIHHGIDLEPIPSADQEVGVSQFPGKNRSGEGNSQCNRDCQAMRHSAEDRRRDSADVSRILRYLRQTACGRQVHRVRRRGRSGAQE